MIRPTKLLPLHEISVKPLKIEISKKFVYLRLLVKYPNMSTSSQGTKANRFRIYNASTLGTALRHYRSQLGISQAELAARTGIPRNYLSALENGLETEQLKRTLDLLRELGVRMTLDHEDW